MMSKTRVIVVMALTIGLMGGCSTGSVTKEEGDTHTLQERPGF